MSKPVVYERPTVYTVSVVPDTYPEWFTWALTVEDRGEGLWVVKSGPFSFCRSDARHANPPRRCPEPIPSSRTDAYLKAYRFPLDEALALARRIAPKVRMAGKTGAEYMAWYHQQQAAEAQEADRGA